jgi:hypothetical protein
MISRGDRREDIFKDDVDRQDFLKTLAKFCIGWEKAGRENELTPTGTDCRVAVR